LIADKLRNNDEQWFRKFTEARGLMEAFLIKNKSLIGNVLQNLSKKGRIPRMRDMFRYFG
jgi:hypothetical protein